MRSFIGAFKFLSRVLPDCAPLVAPLDEAVAGLHGNIKCTWSDSCKEAFSRAQEALKSTKEITVPLPDDHLWFVTDSSVKHPGLGSNLYVTRRDKLRLSGCFSAKLRKRQTDWTPCEVEALSIAASVKHFAPYIAQSTSECNVLTDSRPCVQAYAKLQRGEFSTSARLATFLSTLSRFKINMQHIAGTVNLPADFESRNAPECTVPKCQICSFIQQSEESVVRSVSVSEIMSGQKKIPYTSRAAWLQAQRECQDLRRVHAHLSQGTRPSKKDTNIRDVKRLLQVATIASDGLVIVKRPHPFAPTQECIVVPRQLIEGLLTSLHIRLECPSAYQMKQVASRYFYALDMSAAIDTVSSNCHRCSALSKVPQTLVKHSTSDPPESLCTTFAGDVMKQDRHLIFIARECASSYTEACLIPDEKASTIQFS